MTINNLIIANGPNARISARGGILRRAMRLMGLWVVVGGRNALEVQTAPTPSAAPVPAVSGGVNQIVITG